MEKLRWTDKYLEAVMEMNADALDIAKELDRERSQGKVRGKLHGIPVFLKDVRHTTLIQAGGY